MRARVALAALLLSIAAAGAAAERVEVGRFSLGDLHGWEKKLFSGETRYQLVREAQLLALRAESRASASGLVRRITIDLKQTPYLNWSWKVDNILASNDEHRRGGDDYPARIYVVFSGGLLFWRSRAINYVWSSHQPIGSQWPNAFTSQARMIAVDSGSATLNHWSSHQRNIREDYRQLFGEDIDTADAVAIMSDTDNTGQQATAWYGDIWFSSQ